MKRTPLHVPTFTLFEAFGPVDAYRKAAEVRTGVRPVPPVSLTPLDAYVLRLLADFHPRLRAVYDLAGDPTHGDSAALWATLDPSLPVRVAARPDTAWAVELTDFLRLGACPAPEWVEPAAVAERLRGEADPTLVVLAGAPGADLLPLVEQVHAAAPAAVLAVLPVGLAGADPQLESLLIRARSAGLRLALVRELHPCLGSSRMAVLAPAADAHTSAALERIARLFTGNFDFLALAKQGFALSQELAKQEAEVARLKEAARQAAERHAGDLWAADQRREADARLYQARYDELAAHYHDVAHHYSAVLNSTRWAAVNKLMAVRLWLLPPGSGRERLGKLVMRSGRRLRAAVRR